MAYQAPVNDIMHALKSAAGLDELIRDGVLAGVDEDTVRAVIEEAGKFGAQVLEPLSAPGDRAGSKLVDGKVVTPPGWKEAYRQFAEAGWSALPWIFTPCMVVYSLAYGGLASLQEPIRADYFGAASFGTISGISSMIVMLGMMGGPLVAGILADRTGSYVAGFHILAGMAALGEAVACSRPACLRSSSGSMRRIGISSSSELWNSLTPTTIRCFASTSVWYWKDASAISRCGKFCLIASTMPPSSSILRNSAYAASSMRSVTASTPARPWPQTFAAPAVLARFGGPRRPTRARPGRA